MNPFPPYGVTEEIVPEAPDRLPLFVRLDALATPLRIERRPPPPMRTLPDPGPPLIRLRVRL